MSDDAKLHAREKELLQGEVFEGQKLLKIATDQLKGLRERVFALEEENQRLKFDTSNIQNDSEESETEKTPSYKLNEGPASRNTFQMPTSGRQDSKGDDDNVHKRKVQDLEKKLLEVEDDWKSKYSSIEKAKADLDSKYKRLSEESLKLKDSLLGFKEDVQRKNNQLREIECKINGNSEIVKRKDEIINEQEEIIKLREGDLQSLLDQISSRDNDIKELNDKIRARDERLKEKDEILKTVNETLESKHDEIIFLNTEINEMTEKIKVQDEEKKEMDRKLSEGSNVTKADWETENERLKQELDDMANNLGKLHTDNNTLHVELEKARQALSEAMVLWNKDRAELEVAHNVAQEKLRLYEESVDKKESQIVALLRKETHKILQIKEKISTELRVTKVEHEANMRTLKNEKLKLQDELTQKIRQLTAEMSSNDKMSQDLDRLKAQEDIAFQIQHHEKVVRAEYLAMKVRYETRLENLQKEHMKLLTVLDKLQREKMLDQEIIKGVQKGMGNMKESYNQNLARWKDERSLLESHIKEIQEGKELADSLRKQVDKLKQQLADQEYERAEIIDKITQERSLWQIQRAELQSQRNELQEKLSMASINQSRTKDLQSRMEVAWESERVEQRRLLNEAHTLALDLQNSIRSREEEFSRERKALLEQMKKMRKELDEVQIGKQAKLVQIEDGVKELEELKQKLTETREKADKEHEASIKDRADLVRRLAEFRRTHKRDQRRIEDVLSELTRLRELAAIVVEAEEGGGSSNEELASRLESFASKDTHASAAASPEPPTLRPTSGDLSKRINDLILQYMKESLKEIHFAADDIARPRSRDGTEEERKKMRRSLSSSELDFLLRDDTPVLQQLESLQQSARRRTPTRTPTPTQQLQRNISCRGPGDLKDHDNSDLGDMPELQTGSLIDRQHKIRADVHLDEGIKIKFPTPPPSFLLPRSRQASPGKPVVLTSSTTKTTITTEKTVTTSRKLPKSISLNTSLQQTNLLPKTHMTKSFSADSSPVVDTSPIVTIPTHSNSVEKIQNTKHTENMTPKTARQKFFEVPETWSPSKCYSDENIVTEKDAPTHILWNTKNTENKSSDKDDSSRSKSKLSVSFEDVEAKADATLSNESTIEFSDSKTYKVVKPKRRLFRRAASMENTTVSDTLANAGVSAISAGAPSTMSPSELFAAVKRKFRHPLRRSTSFGEDSKYKRTQEEEHETKIQNLSGCDSSDLNAPCPERKDKIVTPPTPPISMMNRRILPDLDEDRKSRERESRPQKDNARGEKKKRPRSKSAERAQTGASALSQEIIINEDSFTPISGLPFNETSV